MTKGGTRAVTTILIVEDDPGARSLMAVVLDGYRIHACGDLASARVAVEQDPPHVVILDMQLPDGPGTDLLRELQGNERTASIPVIVVTGTVEPRFIANAMKAGAHDFIRKPYEPVELETRVAAAARAKRLRDELTHLATRDPLTGLLNRRGLLQSLESWQAHQHRTGEPLALEMFDVIDFKSVNDAFGHSTGDRVLREVGAAMLDTVRGADVLARWGGDEFMALFPRTNETGVMPLLQRLKDAVAEEVRVPGRRVEVRAGFTVTDSHTDTDALIQAVSESLHRAR
jgi:diguanylate cyclase (GGDEF)-like protein